MEQEEMEMYNYSQQESQRNFQYNQNEHLNNFNSNDTNILQRRLQELQNELAMLDSEHD